MFTLKDLITEKQYDTLVATFTNPDTFYYDTSIYYNNSKISSSTSSLINNSKYFKDFIPVVWRNERNEYVNVDSNIQLIINAIINVVKTYNTSISYDNNPYLTTATFDGDLLDYEVNVSSKLFSVSNFNENNGYLSPYKYEAIVSMLEEDNNSTNITLYSTIESFPFKKNYYFMTTYSLFQDYILKKVNSENQSELARIGNELTTQKEEFKTIIDTYALGTYIKFDASSDYVDTEIINISDIVGDSSIFDIENNDGFVSNDITYIKWDTYNQTALSIGDGNGVTYPNLDILTYNDITDVWDTVSTVNTFNVTSTPVTIITVNGNEVMVDSLVTVGEYISDGTNSYKILSVSDNGDGTWDIIIDKTIIGDDIVIGTNYTFNPILENSEITSIETSKENEVKTIVDNIQVFIIDFEKSGVYIMDLEYYVVGIDDENINYQVVQDEITHYIEVEQNKIEDSI